MEETARPVYPFSAIIGQEEMKFAALMNIIDPNIGGIMVMGDRGTGKSTTVRALVDLLPLIEVVQDDPFMSSPTDPNFCLLYTSPSPRDATLSRMPSSA